RDAVLPGRGRRRTVADAADRRDRQQDEEQGPTEGDEVETMKLPNASKSLWIDTCPGERFPNLKSDRTVDVAIVGGGITDLTAATLLKRAGLTVAVLEAERIAEGVSGLTTA